MKLLRVVAVIGEFKSHNQLVLRIDGALRIIGHLMAMMGRTHQFGVGLA